MYVIFFMRLLRGNLGHRWIRMMLHMLVMVRITLMYRVGALDPALLDWLV